MKILGIDPGEVNIGVAISDPTGVIANPLTVIRHISRPVDAALIAQIALENSVDRIVVGQAADAEGKVTFSGRRARRLAAAIRLQTDIPVVLWDESHSTQTAQQAQIEIGTPRRKRRGEIDKLAATVLLQTYLDSRE